MNAITGNLPFLEWIVLASLALLAYTYLGYPLLLLLRCRRTRKAVERGPITPTVSIVIAAWNEAERLPSRLRNCLGQDYPADRLEIIVVCDGSTDTTRQAIGSFGRDGRVRLVELRTRKGKAVALNEGVASARGEIILFADARQRFAPGAVSELVSNFADPAVGAASGELILESSSREAETEGVGLYWRIEKWIRRKEAELDSVIGVTGAIYAVRRELWEPLPPGTILDDLLVPMRIAMKGYRVVFDHRAIARDGLPDDHGTEFRRKVRTLTGNYQVISLCPDLVKPWRNRLFFRYVSHKLCRLVAPFALLILFGASAVLVDGWSRWLLGGQIAGYVLALAGWGLSRLGLRERFTSAAFTFCFLNFAALVAAVRFLKRDPALWTKSA